MADHSCAMGVSSPVVSDRVWLMRSQPTRRGAHRCTAAPDASCRFVDPDARCGRTSGSEVAGWELSPTSPQLSADRVPHVSDEATKHLLSISPDDDDDPALDAARRSRQASSKTPRLAEVPAEIVVANHVMGLYELAAIHLGAEPPRSRRRRRWRSTPWPAWSRASATASVPTPAPCAMRWPTSAWRSSRSRAAQATTAPAATEPRRSARRAALPSRDRHTPSLRSSAACSRSWPGTSRPTELTTRHHGTRRRWSPGYRPTRRDCAGSRRPRRCRRTSPPRLRRSSG